MSVFKPHLRVVLALLLFVSPAWGMERPDDFQEEANKKFPNKSKFYSYDEIKGVFLPILSPQIQTTFNLYFNIMFNPEFPKPVHSNETITAGYQCLYRKMAYAHTLSDKEEGAKLQLEALYQLLALPGHKKWITKFNPDLGHQIPDFACKNCLDTAHAELGISNK